MNTRLRREQARLLKPTRNNAPTEYNLRYKRWQQLGGTSRTGTAQNKRGKLVKPARIWSSSKSHRQPTTCGTPTVYADSIDEMSGNAATCGTDSFITQFSSEQMITNHGPRDLRETLVTTPASLHSRARESTPGYRVGSDSGTSIQLDTEPPKGNRRRQMNSSRLSVSPKPKRAWLSGEGDAKYQETLQEDISNMLRYLNVNKKDQHNIHPPSVASRKSEKTEMSGPTVTGSKLTPTHQSGHPPVSSIREELQLTSSRRDSYDSLPDEDKVALPTEFSRGWRYYFPEDDRGVPRLNPGGKALPKAAPDCNAFKKKKWQVGDGVGEDSLRKIYTEATVDELQRLKRKFKSILGSNPNGKRVARKPYASITSDLTSATGDGPLSKQDEYKIRRAAFKASQTAGSALNKDAWTTSYSSHYCRKWSGDEYKKEQPTKTPISKDKHENYDQDLEVKEHFKSKDFLAKESSQMKSVVEDEIDEEEEKKDRNEEKLTTNSFIDGAPKSKTVEFAKPERKTDDDVPEVSPSYTEKVLKDAHEIEEREYKNTFRDDGKPKMKFDTAFTQTYKGPACQKPEQPVWAHNTMVSLGSGHWNMLRDHYDGWEPAGDAINNVQQMLPKKVERKKYKVKVYEQGEPCPAKSRVNKDAVMGRYGGDGGTRKTHVNYVTEYMSKFTRMPLPRKKAFT